MRRRICPGGAKDEVRMQNLCVRRRVNDTCETQNEHFLVVLARGMQKALKNTLFEAPGDVADCGSQREKANSTTIFDVASAAAEARARKGRHEAKTLKPFAL